MRRPPESDAASFLAQPKLERDPSSFSEVVSEAYLLEHGAKQKQEIASVLGRAKGRVSQIYGDPKVLKVETMRTILEPISSTCHRRKIVDAWTGACFGDLLTSGKDSIVSASGEKVMRRVDRLIRQRRLRDALAVSSEVYEKARHREEQEVLLDRMFLAHFFLDEHGEAMGIARLIASRAREMNDPLREASAHVRRARLLTASRAFDLQAVGAVFDEIDRLISLAPQPAQRPVYAIITPAQLMQTKLSSRITFMERSGSFDAGELRSTAESLVDGLRPSQVLQHRYWRLFTAARCLGLAGDGFQALELLDRAVDLGGKGIPYSREECGVLYGQFLAATERVEMAVDYLRRMSERCRLHADRYHQRVIELELLKIEQGRF